MRAPLLLLASLCLFTAAPGHCQTPATGPSYDVSTVKPSDSASLGHVGVHINDTVLTTTGTTPGRLLQLAFDVQEALIFNLPKWAESARYDVTAKDSTTDPALLKNFTDAQFETMMQGLMIERFGLKWHTESREVSAYELVAVKPTAVLKPVEKGLPAWAESARFDIVANASDAKPADMHALSHRQRLEMLQTLLAERFAMQTHTETRDERCYELVPLRPSRPAPGLREAKPGSYTGAGLAAVRAAQRHGTRASIHRESGMGELIEDLSTFLHRPVVDQTGLKGTWDIDLVWLRENTPPSAAPADVPGDVFTAVREQLGMELRSTRAPLPALVVDRWARPTEN